jgi:hypothetical protein
MDKARWMEIGLLTGAIEDIRNHSRLLRSLAWGDPDYQGAVYDVVPAVLAERVDDFGPFSAEATSGDLSARFPNLGIVSDFLGLPQWLRDHEPDLHARLIAAEAADATLPDGTVLDAAEAAATRLQVAEMRRQVERIRRDYADDPEALVGQTKEVIETACKTILGLTGTGPETKADVPDLVNKTLVHLGLHPKDADARGEDPAEAHALKRVFGGLTSVLTGAAELRNARGTSHGRSGAPLVDDRMARLTAGMVLPAVIYLCEAYEDYLEKGEAVTVQKGDRVTHVDLDINSVVQHETFGRGTVVSVAGQGERTVVAIDFETAGVKRLLTKYAPVRVIRR